MHFVYGVGNGNATASVEEYRLWYPQRQIPDRHVFTHVHQHLQEKGCFPSVYHCAECQIQRNVQEDENIIDMVHHSPRTSTRRISPCLHVLRMRVWRTLHTEGMYPHHIQHIHHLEPVDTCSQLELCRWINSNPHMILNILFIDKAHFTHDGVNKTRNSHVWDRDNPHRTVKSNFQHLFTINVWCGVVDPYIFLQRLTGDIYANILQDELPAHSENVPLQTWQQMLLPARRSAISFQSCHKAVSES